MVVAVAKKAIIINLLFGLLLSAVAVLTCPMKTLTAVAISLMKKSNIDCFHCNRFII